MAVGDSLHKGVSACGGVGKKGVNKIKRKQCAYNYTFIQVSCGLWYVYTPLATGWGLTTLERIPHKLPCLEGAPIIIF